VINGEPVEFGVSGLLYNSNVVMYDRKTESYWSQLDEIAIVGELAGTRLTPIFMDTVAWGQWKGEHPEAEVLSQDTGHSRPYGVDPYGSYYVSDFVLFPVENTDDRVSPKTLIFGIEVDGVFKAYKEEDLEELGTIEDTVGDTRIRLDREESGAVMVTNLETGERIVKERSFWFAWYAFHPDTGLYQLDSEDN
jgi:hypothetical protein